MGWGRVWLIRGKSALECVDMELMGCRFICTFSVAHVLYLAYTSFARQGSITISNHTLPLWTDILGSRSTNTSIEEGAVWHATEGGTYESAMSGLLGAAEGYMDVGRRYTDLEGRMSEQINK